MLALLASQTSDTLEKRAKRVSETHGEPRRAPVSSNLRHKTARSVVSGARAAEKPPTRLDASACVGSRGVLASRRSYPALEADAPGSPHVMGGACQAQAIAREAAVPSRVMTR